MQQIQTALTYSHVSDTTHKHSRQIHTDKYIQSAIYTRRLTGDLRIYTPQTTNPSSVAYRITQLLGSHSLVWGCCRGPLDTTGAAPHCSLKHPGPVVSALWGAPHTLPHDRALLRRLPSPQKSLTVVRAQSCSLRESLLVPSCPTELGLDGKCSLALNMPSRG